VLKGSGQSATPVDHRRCDNYADAEPPEGLAGTLSLTGAGRYPWPDTAGWWIPGRARVLGDVLRKQGDGSRANVHAAIKDLTLKTRVGPRGRPRC